MQIVPCYQIAIHTVRETLRTVVSFRKVWVRHRTRMIKYILVLTYIVFTYVRLGIRDLCDFRGRCVFRGRYPTIKMFHRFNRQFFGIVIETLLPNKHNRQHYKDYDIHLSGPFQSPKYSLTTGADPIIVISQAFCLLGAAHLVSATTQRRV